MYKFRKNYVFADKTCCLQYGILLLYEFTMTTGYLIKEDGDDCNSQRIKGRLCLLYMLLFEDVLHVIVIIQV